MKIASISILCILSLLTACSNMDGNKYLDMQPPFRLEEYFDGPIKAWGIIQDRSGNVISRFDASIVGSWQGNTGTLDEVFTYYGSGEVQNRTWNITRLEDNRYRASAGDIIGTASGTAYGNAINWKYQMDIPVGGSTYRLSFDDWIWAMNDGVIINRAYLKKFGITFAEITVFMQKT